METMAESLILAGDVGGTKTYLALCDGRAGGFAPLTEARYETARFESLGALLRTFVEEAGIKPGCVVVGVPGPVRQLPVRAVNLPWLIHPEELRTAVGTERVLLLNDLEATAYGTQVLEPEDTVTLNAGTPDPEGNVAVIAAGTGLGEGGLCWTGSAYTAISSEGGHSSFGPCNRMESQLWQYMHTRHGHISWERILSGSGLVSVYQFLRDEGHAEEPSWLAEEMAAADDQAEVVSRVAIQDRCELAVTALGMFIRMYGAEAGNLALKLMSTGGVYVGGGIAPKLVDSLRNGPFMDGFLNKGRMSVALSTIPVQVVLNDKSGLMGAAYRGAQLVSGA